MTTPINLTCCTLTGVDERTDLTRVANLSRDYPVAEWGFLYSPKRQGQPGRYPSVEFLRNAISSLPKRVRVALHVCGQGVHDLLANEKVVSELVEMVALRTGRVQLNFNHAKDAIDMPALHAFLGKYSAMQVITQYNEANAGLWQELQQHLAHAVLFDSSGGRGIKAETWPVPLPISCGYAGGLGPDNLDDALEQLAMVAGSNSFWVDMEGKLRVKDDDGNDWLDYLNCERCLHIAQAHVPHTRWEVAQNDGWWVPVEQFFQQKVLPLTGTWQKVRCHTGIIVEACQLYGYEDEGWQDSGYQTVDGVTEWLKPSEWFRGPDDMVGDIAAMEAYKASLPKSPLRGASA